MLSDANTKAADAKFSSHHIHQSFDVFGHSPSIVSYLTKYDFLHMMQTGLLDHLQTWIFHFIKMHERLNKYNAIWFSVGAYHDLTPNHKSYEVVSQWNGKEMKEMSQCLLGVVTQPLQGGSPTQPHIFNLAIECKQAVLEFYLYA
jgi:hypothetical protein